MAQIVKGPADKPGDFNSTSDIHQTEPEDRVLPQCILTIL